ncbi:hypothetical protein RHS01_00027 [Rhizoctonia solani]|uniref:Uncharacterized protein n=1 Tax=Rhizoctonia solani TaxID=456999 RepID=A0A8H7IL50_9AGAM|nr:hypothetical protein RHS01_00027 [Rhizoctonia solani]
MASYRPHQQCSPRSQPQNIRAIVPKQQTLTIVRSTRAFRPDVVNGLEARKEHGHIDGTQKTSCESRLRAHPSLSIFSPPAIALRGFLWPESKRQIGIVGYSAPSWCLPYSNRRIIRPETIYAPSGEHATELMHLDVLEVAHMQEPHLPPSTLERFNIRARYDVIAVGCEQTDLTDPDVRREDRPTRHCASQRYNSAIPDPEAMSLPSGENVTDQIRPYAAATNGSNTSDSVCDPTSDLPVITPRETICLPSGENAAEKPRRRAFQPGPWASESHRPHPTCVWSFRRGRNNVPAIG